MRIVIVLVCQTTKGDAVEIYTIILVVTRLGELFGGFAMFGRIRPRTPNMKGFDGTELDVLVVAHDSKRWRRTNHDK